MKFISHMIRLIKNDSIPKDPAKVKALLKRMEEEERIYQETQNNIKRIIELKEKKKERAAKPQTASIYERCDECNELFLKSDDHRCYE